MARVRAEEHAVVRHEEMWHAVAGEPREQGGAVVEEQAHLVRG